LKTRRRPLRFAALVGTLLAVTIAGNAAAAGLTVTFTSLPVAHRDNPTSASVKTTAGAACTIKVKYRTDLLAREGAREEDRARERQDHLDVGGRQDHDARQVARDRDVHEGVQVRHRDAADDRQVTPG